MIVGYELAGFSKLTKYRVICAPLNTYVTRGWGIVLLLAWVKPKGLLVSAGADARKSETRF
jgi:hypothetical protein